MTAPSPTRLSPSSRRTPMRRCLRIHAFAHPQRLSARVRFASRSVESVAFAPVAAPDNRSSGLFKHSANSRALAWLKQRASPPRKRLFESDRRGSQVAQATDSTELRPRLRLAYERRLPSSARPTARLDRKMNRGTARGMPTNVPQAGTGAVRARVCECEFAECLYSAETRSTAVPS